MNHFHSAIQFTQKCAMKNKMNQVVKTVCMTFLVASKDLLIFFISLKQKKKKELNFFSRKNDHSRCFTL